MDCLRFQYKRARFTHWSHMTSNSPHRKLLIHIIKITLFFIYSHVWCGENSHSHSSCSGLGKVNGIFKKNTWDIVGMTTVPSDELLTASQ